MKPVSDFDELVKALLESEVNDDTFVVGILIADWRQQNAREYILNYMDRFDRKSGKNIDFYIPGYKYIKKGNKQRNTDNVVRISRMPGEYEFDEDLFMNVVDKLEDYLKIDYTYNPMLVLVEIKTKQQNKQLEYAKKLIIALDEGPQGINRAGQLFEKIFSIAARGSNVIVKTKNSIRMTALKGIALDVFIDALSGDFMDILQDTIRTGNIFAHIRGEY